MPSRIFKSMVFIIAFTSATMAFSRPVFAYDFDPAVPPALRELAKRDLEYLASIESKGTQKGASPLHREIFGAVDGRVYMRWFNLRIKHIGFDAEVDERTGEMIAYNDDNRPDTVVLTGNYLRPGIPRIVRLMILLHEARHAEPTAFSWGHFRCPKVFNDESGRPIVSRATGIALADRLACDYSVFGGYGTAGVFLNNIERFCTSCDAATKNAARLFQPDQFNRVIGPAAREKILNDSTTDATTDAPAQ